MSKIPVATSSHRASTASSAPSPGPIVVNSSPSPNLGPINSSTSPSTIVHSSHNLGRIECTDDANTCTAAYPHPPPSCPTFDACNGFYGNNDSTMTDHANVKCNNITCNSHLPNFTSNRACSYFLNHNNTSHRRSDKHSSTRYQSHLPISTRFKGTTKDTSVNGQPGQNSSTTTFTILPSQCAANCSPPSFYSSSYDYSPCPPFTPVSHSDPIATINHRNESPSPSLKSPPKFEAFMMTGDLMINLASKTTTDNPLAINKSPATEPNLPATGGGVQSNSNVKRTNFNRKYQQQLSSPYNNNQCHDQSSNLPNKFSSSLPSSPESMQKQHQHQLLHQQQQQQHQQQQQQQILQQPSSKTDHQQENTPANVTTSPLHKQKTFAVRLTKSQHELLQASPPPTQQHHQLEQQSLDSLGNTSNASGNDECISLECETELNIHYRNNHDISGQFMHQSTLPSTTGSATIPSSDDFCANELQCNESIVKAHRQASHNEFSTSSTAATATTNGNGKSESSQVTSNKNNQLVLNSLSHGSTVEMSPELNDMTGDIPSGKMNGKSPAPVSVTCYESSLNSNTSSSTSSSFKSSTSSSSSSTYTCHGDTCGNMSLSSDLTSNTSTVKSTASSLANSNNTNTTGAMSTNTNGHTYTNNTTLTNGSSEESNCKNKGDNSSSTSPSQQPQGKVEESAKRYPSFIGSTVPDDECNEVDDDEINLTSDTIDSLGSNLTIKNSYPFSPPKAVDVASASRLARRLFDLQGFKKCDVSRHLSKNNEFSKAVAEEYLKLFEFTGDRVDCALRKFLTKFNLVGETADRERVLSHFSKRILECNPDSFKNVDSIHTLTCALMLLNTDLHSESVGRRMTLSEFMENLSGLHDGSDFNQDLLKALYFSIKNQPLQWAHDEDDSGSKLGGPNSANLTSLLAGCGDSSDTSGKSLLDQSANPFLGLPSGTSATEFKKGYLLRKCCYDATGKKTPIGKRRWKNFYATLRDLVLYLHKDETGFRKNQLYESLKNSIRIHHALATKATDYVKKEFVFRLHTADQAEYLFKASDAHEMQLWIDGINFAAASLSSPPLAPAVGSEPKFQRPLLPVSHTKLGIREQLLDHEERINSLEQELEIHLNCPPERSTLKRSLNEYTEKQLYLQFELKRYRVYSQLLKLRLIQSMGPQALEKVINSKSASSLVSVSGLKSKPLTSLPIEEADEREFNVNLKDPFKSESTTTSVMNTPSGGGKGESNSPPTDLSTSTTGSTETEIHRKSKISSRRDEIYSSKK